MAGRSAFVAELGGSELRAARHRRVICVDRGARHTLSCRIDFNTPLERDPADLGGRDHGNWNDTQSQAGRGGNGSMMTAWLLVLTSMLTGTAGDLLMAKGMNDHGEIHDFRPRAVLLIISRLFSNVYIAMGILAQAASFFSFVALLAVTDLSFAVPAT